MYIVHERIAGRLMQTLYYFVIFRDGKFKLCQVNKLYSVNTLLKVINNSLQKLCKSVEKLLIFSSLISSLRLKSFSLRNI